MLGGSAPTPFGAPENGGRTVPPHESDRSCRRSRPALRPPVRVLIVRLGRIVAMLPFTGAAQAHGTIVNPASRAYQCWQNWGNQHMNPARQQQEPMRWQAFQANPDTMWNWMSAL